MDADQVFSELTRASQTRFVGLRRRTNFFDMFGAAVMEALRERGYRLTRFDRAGDNLELSFEQRDLDECRILILPYRTDLPYLCSKGFMAQVKLEVSRFCHDPDLLRRALEVNTRASFGSFLGGGRMPRLDLQSDGGHLVEPGTMTFELRGSRLCAGINVVLDLNPYRQSDFDLDLPRIGADLAALFYGVEKYLHLLVGRLEKEAAPAG